MTLTRLGVWIVLAALGVASYLGLAVSLVVEDRVPSRRRWTGLVPPVACWTGLQAGGIPRVLAIVFMTTSLLYVLARWGPY